MNARLASLAFALLLVAPAVALAQSPPGSGSGDTSLAPPPPGAAGDAELAPPPPGNATPAGSSSSQAWPPPQTPPPGASPYAAPAPAPSPTTAATYDGAAGASAAPGMTSAQAADLLEQQRRRKIHLIYAEVTGGVHWLDMATVSSSNFLPPTTTQTSGIGGTGGVAAGIRPVDFLAIGGRGQLGLYPNFNFGIAAAEVSLILTTQVVEAYLRAGFGYAWVGNANYMDPASSMTTVYGFAFTSSLGLDVYLSDAFSLGAAFDVDVVNLARQPLTTGSVMMAGMVDLTKDGNAVGVHVGGHAALTLHFL